MVTEEQTKTRMTKVGTNQSDYNYNLQSTSQLTAKEANEALITPKGFKENWRAVVKLKFEMLFLSGLGNLVNLKKMLFLHNFS